jgi:tetratricopeptide (TPR) repeat protein
MKERYRPKPPSFFNNTVSGELDALILKCLEFRSFDRFYDAKELHRAICELEGHKDPIRSIPDSIEKLEELLKKKDISVEIRFKALYQLGTLYEGRGDLIRAADYLEQAWDFTKNRAILRTITDRVQLLERIEQIYEKLGNRFRMKQYQNLKNSMLREVKKL